MRERPRLYSGTRFAFCLEPPQVGRHFTVRHKGWACSKKCRQRLEEIKNQFNTSGSTSPWGKRDDRYCSFRSGALLAAGVLPSPAVKPRLGRMYAGRGPQTAKPSAPWVKAVGFVFPHTRRLRVRLRAASSGIWARVRLLEKLCPPAMRTHHRLLAVPHNAKTCI